LRDLKLRRSDDRETHLVGDPHGNHVPLDKLAKLDTCVILTGDKVDRVVGRSDLQDDFGIDAIESSQRRLLRGLALRFFGLARGERGIRETQEVILTLVSREANVPSSTWVLAIQSSRRSHSEGLVRYCLIACAT
jgi:hypothetical protein